MADFDSLIRQHFAELALFLFMFGMVMQWPAGQLLILNKSCRGLHSEEVCASLTEHPETEAEIQNAATFWIITVPSIGGVISAFSSLIMGSASDWVGRGMIIMVNCSGCIVASICFLVQIYVTHLSTGLLLFSTLSMGLTGGVGAFTSALFDFVTDNTPANERTKRLSVVHPFAALGVIFGMLSSSIVLRHFGFAVVYSITLCTQAAILFLAAKYMRQPEIAKTTSSEVTPRPDLIATVVGSLLAGARICLKPRPDNRRKHILFIVLCGVISMAGVGCDMGVMVFYTRRSPFNWEPTMQGYFSTARNVGQIVGMVLGTRVLLRLVGTSASRQDDLTLMQIGSVSTMAGAVVMYGALTSYHLVLVPLLDVVSGPSRAASGSFSSKLIQPSEKGAFSAFSTFLNNLAFPAGTFFFTTVYTWSSSSLPGFVYLLQACMYIAPLVLITLMKADVMKTTKTDA